MVEREGNGLTNNIEMSFCSISETNGGNIKPF